jgi:pimeloyl-ACP methyl ester carboxylesterase
MSFWPRVLLFGLLLLQVPTAFAQLTYVRRNPARSETVIFVHGVLGNSRETWFNQQSGAWWPKLLATDKAFDKANIATLDLPTSMWNRGPAIDELADMVRQALEADESIRGQKLVFVAHSMGGVVVRAFLSKYRNYASKTRMLYFLGVPTTGASIASIAQLVSKNSQFRSLEPMSNASFLATLQRTWLAAPELRSLPTFCAYELRPTMGLMVVEQQSATNLCNEQLDPLDGDHSGIVKPSDVESRPHQALRAAFLAASKNRVPEPSVQSDEDVLVPKALIRDANLIADCVYYQAGGSEPIDSPRWRCQHQGYAYVSVGNYQSENETRIVSARLNMRGISSHLPARLGSLGFPARGAYDLMICLPSNRQAEIALNCLAARNFPASKVEFSMVE